MHTQPYTGVHTHSQTFIHTDITFTNIHTLMHTDTGIRTYTFTNIHTLMHHTHSHTFFFISSNAYTHVIHTDIYITYSFIYMRTHIHTHTHSYIHNA